MLLLQMKTVKVQKSLLSKNKQRVEEELGIFSSSFFFLCDYKINLKKDGTFIGKIWKKPNDCDRLYNEMKTWEEQSMTKAMLVINPSSGGERASYYKHLALATLRAKFGTVELRETTGPYDATRFAREACENYYDAFFVMGGDGTVNEGISGLAEQPYRPKFGFFPLGTVNDLARALGISLHPRQAIMDIEDAVLKPLDIGKINDHYFMNVVALGDIPEELNNVKSEQKTKLGKLAYSLAGVKALKENEQHEFLLNMDGEEINLTTSLIMIGLTSSIGGFKHMIDPAEVDDGKLHFIALLADNLFDTLMVAPTVLSGDLINNEKIYYREFEHLHIALENEEISPFSANVDGDRDDPLPLDISVLPQHLEVYVPRKK